MRARSISTGFSLVAALAILAAACGGDSASPSNPGGNNGGNNGGTAPTPLSGVAATPLSSSSIRVSFTTRLTDNSYSVERAEGSGAFSAITSVAAPASVSTLAVTDA